MKTPLAALSLLALLAPATPALAAEPEATPPWAASVRAGAFVLNSANVPGHPSGPDLELSLGRTIYELVSIELSAGAYRVALTGTGTTVTAFPLTVSLRLAGPTDLGFEPYAVAGLGASLTRFTGGSLAGPLATSVVFHAGLGVRRRFGSAFFAGLEGRYVFQDAPSASSQQALAVYGWGGLRLDGLRASALAGLVF